MFECSTVRCSNGPKWSWTKSDINNDNKKCMTLTCLFQEEVKISMNQLV